MKLLVSGSRSRSLRGSRVFFLLLSRLLHSSLFPFSIEAKPSSPRLFLQIFSKLFKAAQSWATPSPTASRRSWRYVYHPRGRTKQQQRRRRGEMLSLLSEQRRRWEKKKKKKKKNSLDCYGCGGNESARPPLHTLLSLLLAPFSRHHRAQHDVLSSSCVVAC